MTEFEFTNGRLWAASGRVRRKANPDVPAHRAPGDWDRRTVVFVAKDYQDAHEKAADAMLMNFSTHPHEAELYAVRPADTDDLVAFKYGTEPTLRVLVEERAS